MLLHEFVPYMSLHCNLAAMEQEARRPLQSGETLAVDALFIAVGRQPRTEPFARLVELDPGGYIRAGEDCRTTAQGIFCAGDCRTKSTRQLCTAAADGAAAALGLCEWLSNEKKQA